MITFKEVRQISNRLAMDNVDMPLYDISDNDLSGEILYIIYRTDVYETGGATLISRHIDIEYTFGEFYEISENTPLFQYIAILCNLPLLQEERESVIYEKEGISL